MSVMVINSIKFFKVVTKYGLGLSATMKRKDGLTKVLKWFLGPIVCKIERKGGGKENKNAINGIDVFPIAASK